MKHVLVRRQYFRIMARQARLSTELPQGQPNISVWNQAISEYLYCLSVTRNLKLHCPQSFVLLQINTKVVDALEQGVFNAWPAGHMWPKEPFAVARRPF
jgi:hypothetical protein